MLTHTMAQRTLKGLSLHEHTPITHQQFVDDNLLVVHPSVQEARSFNTILATFSKASSMTINLEKYEIFFFNTPLSTQRNIFRILGFKAAKLPSKYLGAPLTDSTLKHSPWRELLTKLELRLSQWTLHMLNLAGCLVLIKFVLQAMPLYLFSVLTAPKWVLKHIKKLQKNFLWSSTNNRQKWSLVSWKQVCLPKLEGGLGIRDP